ncbi:acyl-CoA reductase [Syntrophomonas palmitatica]|uniref:acyl-CoA reductase n=1 Tax=Syntrophomonas palmitatica TaxID=402877 RepID=UPI000A56E229|nr:acyl-CoA reductase [Syntrophomonas palmitatica]
MIHTMLRSDKYKELRFVVGNEDTLSQMLKISPLQPFSDEVLSFLNDLSKKVMRSGTYYSDVMTFGFWCRRAALQREKNNYDDIAHRLGRGIVFHSTPSNVPVNFAFSFAAGLLAGNANIVRIPAKEFEQVKIICLAVNELLEDSHKNLASYICMVKYPAITEITDIFSSICDSRVIWGGDRTIEEIRESPLKPRANEITFADRYSIAVINADEYLKADNKDRIAQDFYNDTYFSDQNACTAPRIIIWLGNKKDEAKKEFWGSVYLLVKEKYTLAPVQSVGKLHALYKIASQREVKLEKGEDQLINRIAVSYLDNDLMNYKYNSGFFFEYDAVSLHEIIPVCDERCQTLTYYGLSKDELEQFLVDHRPHGVDRVVPMGKSMDFNLVWDGYDLIRSLSRKISVI